MENPHSPTPSFVSDYVSDNSEEAHPDSDSLPDLHRFETPCDTLFNNLPAPISESPNMSLESIPDLNRPSPSDSELPNIPYQTAEQHHNSTNSSAITGPPKPLATVTPICLPEPSIEVIDLTITDRYIDIPDEIPAEDLPHSQDRITGQLHTDETPPPETANPRNQPRSFPDTLTNTNIIRPATRPNPPRRSNEGRNPPRRPPPTPPRHLNPSPHNNREH